MRRSWFPLGWVGVLGLLLNVACGSDDPEPGPGKDPTADAKIVSFEARPQSVLRGEKVQLVWETEDAHTVRLYAGDESIPTRGQSPAEGGVEVEVEEATTFRLVAVGRSGVEAEATAQVTVREPGEPGILRFAADPTETVAGQMTALRWEVVETEEVTISTVEGVVTTSRSPEGSFNVAPEFSTTYTLTATGPGGEATETFTVVVTPAIVRLEATPEVVGATPEAPATVVVLWQTIGARQLELVAEPGGPVDLTGTSAEFGQVEVEITGDTTFRLEAFGEGTSSTQSVSVDTSSVPTIASFVVPEIVGAGEAFRIQWSVRNALSIELEKNGVAMNVPGDRLEGEEIDILTTGEAHYLLRAVGEEATVVAEAEVVVGEPVIVAFAPESERVEPGSTVSVFWETKGGSRLSIVDAAGDELLRTTDRVEILSGNIELEAPLAQDYLSFQLRIENSSGAAEATVGVVVGDGPTVQSFEATPAVLARGMSTALIWVVGEDVEGEAPQLSLVDHEGTSHDVTDAGGRFDVTLDDAGTHTFTLQATTPAGTMEAVTVVEVVPPPTVTLTATPDTLDPDAVPGESVTLSWTTTGATEVHIFHEDDTGVRTPFTSRTSGPTVEEDDHPAFPLSLPATYVAVANNAFGETEEASVTITAR